MSCMAQVGAYGKNQLVRDMMDFKLLPCCRQCPDYALNLEYGPRPELSHMQAPTGLWAVFAMHMHSLLCGCLAVAHQHFILQHAWFTFMTGQDGS